MKLGLQVNRFDWPGGEAELGQKYADVVRTAEAVGFDSTWVMDHYYQIEPGLGVKEDPMLEAYSALHFAAGHTERIKLGVMVTGVIYREPGFLVKQASTLDVLSGGRSIFGIGAAWYENEAHGFGFEFPSTAERFERLEEALQIAKRMWSGDFSPFEGTHYTLRAPINSPQPIQQPHPPILIGGEGETKTLRLVAQYGDACNLFARRGLENVERKLKVLREHCERLGRDYDEIEKTVIGPMDLTAESVDQAVERLGQLAEIGVQHYIMSIPDVYTLVGIEMVGRELKPQL